MTATSGLQARPGESETSGLGAAGRVVVVVPTYNEAENVPELVRQLFALDIRELALLIVDDASPDGTASLADGLSPRFGGRIHVLRRPGKRGLGTAYLEGFAWALDRGAHYVIEMDADLSHSPTHVSALLEAMERCDVAVGSRWVPGGGADPGWGLGRRILSKGASVYCRMILGLKVKDATTGFKCFRRSALEGLDLQRVRSQGFAFQVEMAYACQRMGYRVEEVPIHFRQRARGRSKMSLRIILEAMWRVLAIRMGREAIAAPPPRR